MNDQDLLDELTRSTDWTNDLTTDPAADIARGRSRLRRWRLATGAAALSALAVAAVGVSGAVGHLAGLSEAPAAGFAAPVTTQPPMYFTKYIDILAAHVDPATRYLAQGGGAQKGDVIWAEAQADWNEHGGRGIAIVKVDAKGAWGGAPGQEVNQNRSDKCALAATSFTFTSCKWMTTADGKHVLVGTRASAPKAYFASYVRPDGGLAIALVDGDGNKRWPSRRVTDEAGKVAPVPDPSVTLAGLIATVTDPSLTLG
jgi:hypothetical protein